MVDSRQSDRGDSPDTRAAEIFRDWLARRDDGEQESLDELLERNLELRTQISSLSVQHEHCEDLVANAEGRTLGDFRIIREIGRGGMGIVYEAEQLSLHRSVAVKILPAQLTFNERALSRFQKEASVTARMHHRGIIDIHAIGEHDGVYFIAMELVEGSSLAAVIDRMRGEEFEELAEKKLKDVVEIEPLRASIGADSTTDERPDSHGSTSATDKNYIESVAKLVIQVADALQHAHDAGVVHRDVKPANILLRRDGSAVLTDFGLAREQGLPGITQTGEFAGTPHYVSPEQAMAHRVPSDHRTDVFSLGATLYELLTLERAFDGETAHEVLAKIISKEPTPPQKLNPALHPDLVTIVLKALDKDPDRRYPSTAALADDLRALLSFRPIKGRRTPTVVRALRWVRREPLKAALGVVLAVAVPLVAWLGNERFTQARILEEQTTKLLPIEIAQAVERGFQSLSTRSYSVAVDAFASVLERDPTSVEAKAGLVMALLGLDEPESAMEQLGPVEASSELPPSLQRLMASTQRKIGNELNAEIIEANLAARLETESRSHLDLYLESVELLGSFPLDVFNAQEVQVGEGGVVLSADRFRPVPAPSARGEQERALAGAKKAIAMARRSDPRKLYYCAWAWAAAVAEQADEAREAAEALVLYWPEQADALWYAGVATEPFDTQLAREHYEKSVELDPSSLDTQVRIEWIKGDEDPPSMDLDTLNRYAQSKPPSAVVLANHAAGLFGQGRYEEAIAKAEEALELDEELYRAWDTIGTSYELLGRRDEAIEAFENGLAINPASYEMLCDLGYLHMWNEDYDEALEALETAHEVRPTASRPLVASAAIHVVSGDADAARAQVERLEGLEPELRDLPRLAEVQYQLGNYREAAECFRTLARSELGNPVHYANASTAFGAAGQFAEQLEVLQEQLRETPQSPQALNALAWFHVDPDHPNEHQDPVVALELAARAVELAEAPDLPGILDTLARAQATTGSVDAAVATERRAIDAFLELPPEARDEGTRVALEAALAELDRLAAEGSAVPE